MINVGFHTLHWRFVSRLAAAGVVTVNTPDGVLVSDSAIFFEHLAAYTLDRAKDDRKDDVRELARSKYDAATAGISAAEMAGWPILLSEAVAYRAGSTTHPALDAEASIRGITVEALVQKVEGNAAQFQAARAAIAGTDGKKRDEIDALTSFEAIAAYDVAGGWPL